MYNRASPSRRPPRGRWRRGGASGDAPGVSRLALISSFVDPFNLRPRKREKCRGEWQSARNRVRVPSAPAARNNIRPARRTLGPIGLAGPRYRAERSFSPAAIFTRDSGALWASNGGRVILNNSSYRRNAQVRVCQTAGYARRRARSAALEDRSSEIPGRWAGSRHAPATSLYFVVRLRSVAPFPFPCPPCTPCR